MLYLILLHLCYHLNQLFLKIHLYLKLYLLHFLLYYHLNQSYLLNQKYLKLYLVLIHL